MFARLLDNLRRSDQHPGGFSRQRESRELTAIRSELQSKGIVAGENHPLKVLVQQQDLTGADRRWAARCAVNDELRYSRGSQSDRHPARQLRARRLTNLQENLLTVETKTGEVLTYDPSRLSGVSIYRETEQPFDVGDRLQFTAPDKSIGVANRELGTIQEDFGGGRPHRPNWKKAEP